MFIVFHAPIIFVLFILILMVRGIIADDTLPILVALASFGTYVLWHIAEATGYFAALGG